MQESKQPGQHPSDDVLLAFLTGRLSENQWPTIEAHIDECLRCAERMANLPIADDPLVVQLRESSRPEHQSTVVTNSNTPTPDSNCVSSQPQKPPEFIGRFRVVRQIGQGGMGQVLLAHDSELGRQVALKLPRQDVLSDATYVQSIMHEAKLAAKLNHPGVVVVHDVHRTNNEQICIVQQYVEGSNLREWLSNQDQLGHADFVRMLIQIAEAMQFAHKKNVFHRDLKPENILVDLDGKTHITDFGLALTRSVLHKLKLERSGTASYMSPEQVRGESHRIDGRTDIWALGVILYEALTQKSPFMGDTREEQFAEIIGRDPLPLRQVNPGVADELERICLKCLEKQQEERYQSVAALIDDLRHWLKSAGSKSGDSADESVEQKDPSERIPAIVPKGLRSFDEQDADFFLELLPGPRDRKGLPESIRFWKSRIERSYDGRDVFSVGVIMGPSGSGKSSLVKAGLLPRLDKSVQSIYVEATPDQTEVRLVNGLLAHSPHRDKPSLPELLLQLREQGLEHGRKLLIVIDQFEQWLQTHRDDLPSSQLVNALRQCDGDKIQCIVLVRDDFSMPCHRFLKQLEVDFREQDNAFFVDLFDTRHAKKVLRAFGRAYGALPDGSDRHMQEQDTFMTRAVKELAGPEGRVVCVQLTLFCEMVKGRPWTPVTLRKVGGTEGVGVAFLEETLSDASRNPRQRVHHKAACEVLKVLLPDSGDSIKRKMKSYEELLEASGYSSRLSQFADLIEILDGELRLITPTDSEVEVAGTATVQPGSESAMDRVSQVSSNRRYYQLTHDYLVPPLRKWLTLKQRATRQGRAEICLADRTAQWQAKRESRYMPSAWEYLNILLLTDRKSWKKPQRIMMRRSARAHGLRWGLAAAAALLVLFPMANETAHVLQRDRDARRFLTEQLLEADPKLHAVRIAWAAFVAGDKSLAEEICQLQRDPTQRSRFVNDIPSWQRELGESASVASTVKSPDLRSALCLIAGSTSLDKVPNWKPVLLDWYENGSSSGTHSAAGWALRQWGVKLPPISPTREPPVDRDWWHDVSGLTMLRIPSGTLEQRNDSQEITSTEVDEFWLASHEITIKQFNEFVNDKGYWDDQSYARPKLLSSGDPNDPAGGVSWYDTLIFCNWLSKQSNRMPFYRLIKITNLHGESSGNDYRVEVAPHADGFRLPTETEWEYACRAGTTTKFAFGDDVQHLHTYAVYGRGVTGIKQLKSGPVGSKLPNGWGLFDMHGNVWESCQRSPNKAHIDNILFDPTGVPATERLRAYRGGSWFTNDPNHCASDSRVEIVASEWGGLLGLRVAL